MHPVALELTTSPSTLPLQGEEVPFELELIGKIWLGYIQKTYV